MVPVNVLWEVSFPLYVQQIYIVLTKSLLGDRLDLALPSSEE